MSQFRTAVIGVGYLGRFHAQKYAQATGSRLIAVVDATESARMRVAAETGARPVADYRELLGEVDAVSVVTPTPAHFQIAHDFLRAGRVPLLRLLRRPETGLARVPFGLPARRAD